MTEIESLAFGREVAAIPGPSIMPDQVLAAFSEPMPDLYEGPFVELSDRVRSRIPEIARTSGEGFIVIGNGHAAWQMATSNTLAAGDKVLVLESGRFATVWGEYTSVSDVEIVTLPGDDRLAVDPQAVADRLAADTGEEIKAVLIAHVDTATSVRNDIPAIRAAIDSAGHPALLMVDCIASMACEPFLMDEWGVDIAVAASQKGLMVPPGISFVWANDKAFAAHDRADRRVGYFDWGRRRQFDLQYFYYAGTPPIPHIRALNVALEMIDDEGGLEAVWCRHQVMGDAVRAAVSAWSSPGKIDFNITDPAARSNCVTTVRTGAIDPDRLRHASIAKTGLTLGFGLAEIGGFRIAHMGHLNPPMLLGTLATIESVLIAIGEPPPESGIAAAAEVIGRSLA